jgi:hypothetical protein
VFGVCLAVVFLTVDTVCSSQVAHSTPAPSHSPKLVTPLTPRFTAAKRFGLEGCETLIPGMKAMIDRWGRVCDADVHCSSVFHIVPRVVGLSTP